MEYEITDNNFGNIFAGMGAGLGTGFAGMSAAAVISPMLITFCMWTRIWQWELPCHRMYWQAPFRHILTEKQESGY